MTYEFRHADGRVCCSTDNPEHLCAKCRERVARSASETFGSGYEPFGQPPDPYAIALAKQKDRA